MEWLMNRGAPPAMRVMAACCVFAMLQLDPGGLLMRGDLVRPAVASDLGAKKLLVLVVPPDRKRKADAVDLERLMIRFAGRLDGVKPLTLSPTAGAEEGSLAATRIEDAFRALTLRMPKRAAQQLAAATKLLTKEPAAGDTRLWARYYKASSLTALAMNQLIKARDLLIKSLVLFPAQTDAEYNAYGTTARQLFKTVQRAAGALPTGDLRFGGKSKGAEVWLDGVYKGRVPTTLSDIPVGEHRVTLRMAGRTAQRQMVAVVADKDAKVNADLQPATFGHHLSQGRAVLRANFKQQSVIEDRVRELRTELGADAALVVRARFNRKDTVLAGYYLGADGAVEKVEIKIAKDLDYLDNLAAFVAGTAKVKLLPDASGKPLDPRKSVVVKGPGAAGGIGPGGQPLPAKPEEVPITKKWWFWASVGGGALLVGGIIALAVTSEDPPAALDTGSLRFRIHKASGN